MNCRSMYKPDRRELHDPSKTPGETKNAGVGPAQRTLPEPAAPGPYRRGPDPSGDAPPRLGDRQTGQLEEIAAPGTDVTLRGHPDGILRPSDFTNNRCRLGCR